MSPFWKKVSVLAAISLTSWLIIKYTHADWEKRKRKVNSWGESHWLFGIWWLIDQESNECNDCQIKPSDDSNSFKYGSFDLNSSDSECILNVSIYDSDQH